MTNRRIFSLPVLVGIFCCAVPNSLSAEPRLGRTSDGTPYRTDAEGNQLADHIAELEVTILDLRKQVAALEDELDQGQVASVRAAQDAKMAPAIQPRLSDNSSSQEFSRLRSSEASCQQAKSALEQDVVRLRQAEARGGISAHNCDSITAPLREQITKLQTALMDSPSKERLAGAMERGSQLETDVTKTKQTLSAREISVRALEIQLADAKTEISRLKESLSTRENREQEIMHQVAQLQPAQEITIASAPVVEQLPVYSRTAVARASLEEPVKSSETPSDTIAAVVKRESQKSFRSTLSTIQTLILKRKELLDSAKSRRREVSVRVQPLMTKRGDSLDKLRVQVDKFETKTESDSIGEGLEEIKNILDQDVSLLKRLS